MGRGPNRGSSWFGQRTNLEKTLLSLVCVLLVTLIILLIVGVSHSVSDTGVSTEDNECSSSECIVTAGRVLSQVHPESNPCQDLYSFACGRWAGSESSAGLKATNALYQQIKHMLESENEGNYLDSAREFYKTCMGFEGIKGVRLLNLMIREGLGDWPVLVPAMAPENRTSLTDRLATLAMMGVPVAFSATPIADPDNPETYLLEIGPGSPFLGLNRSEESIRNDMALRDQLKAVLSQLGAPNIIRVNTAVDDIIAVEGYFALVAQTSCDTMKTLAPEQAVNELDRLIPEMDWASLIDRMKREAGLERPFSIRVRCKQQIRDYMSHLSEEYYENDRVPFNYLGWRFFKSLAPHVRGKRRSGGPPRWEECVREAERTAGHALAKALVPSSDIEEKASVVENSVLSALDRLSQKASWLDQDQKRALKLQVQAAKEVHWPFISIQPMELPRVAVSNYTSVVVNLRRQQVTHQFKRLNPLAHVLPGELYLTSDSPPDAPSLLLDKMGEPYLSAHSPLWMNFGGFGVFTAWKHLRQLKSADSSMEENMYWQDNKAVSCLRQKAGHLITMNGSESFLKELFFEAGAMEAAFEAASGSGPDLPGLSRFNDQQLFFISFAQTQCEPKHSQSAKHRVNTLASSSASFDKAFGCETQQPKCSFWT